MIPSGMEISQEKKMNKVELIFGELDFLLTFRNHLDQKIQMSLRLSCMIICETFPTSCG